MGGDGSGSEVFRSREIRLLVTVLGETDNPALCSALILSAILPPALTTGPSGSSEDSASLHRSQHL